VALDEAGDRVLDGNHAITVTRGVVTARKVHRYGDHSAQVAELFPPVEEPRGVAVVIHGGFWRAGHDRHLMDDLCLDLAAAGWAAWNLEYRRLGKGGGWPMTFEDVAAGIDTLSSQNLGLSPDVQQKCVVSIGHSAGGHLALWAAGRTEAAVRVTHAVAQAGVVDLAEAMRLRLSRNAARELLGGDDPERLRRASPMELLPLGVPQLLVHGARDDIVPAAMSEAYAARARELGDHADLVVLPRVGHFEHLDPGSDAWRVVRDWLP
jgi:acetyl esterase/lipase